MSFENFIEPVFDSFAENISATGKSIDIADFEISDDYIPEVINLNFPSLEDLLEWIGWMWEGGIEVVILKWTVLASGVVVVTLLLKHRPNWKPAEN